VNDEATLRTTRLIVRPMGEGDFDALLQGLEDPDRPWADGYPLDESLVSAAMVQERHRDDHELASDPWTQYQVIAAESGTVVGDLTFLEPPDDARVAMLTFGIAPSRRATATPPSCCTRSSPGRAGATTSAACGPTPTWSTRAAARC